MEFLNSLKQRSKHYNSPFGHWELNKPLTEEAVVWLKNLLKKTLSYEDYEFVKSVCKMGKMPTVKQRNKLKLIWKKKHINKIWKRK